jgi:nucleoside phosphorylase
VTDQVDILIVNALQMELDAANAALSLLGVDLERSSIAGIQCWTCTLETSEGPRRVALARPTRMGAVPVTTTASSLVAHLRPTCLAMSGVCAGNPDDVSLGDVLVAEMAYAYDEGKRTTKGFQGDHRQVLLSDDWVRIAQDLSPDGLPTYGVPSQEDRRIWLLEQLAAKADPARHPARLRYLDDQHWELIVRTLESEGKIVRRASGFVITRAGREDVATRRAYKSGGAIAQLPFSIHVGPVASGNAVVKDGVTWASLVTQGVRTVIGLEMEAAAIAQVAHRLDVPRWIVVKGVMDYADPNKDDRFKAFAAAASSQVLMRILQAAPFPKTSLVNDKAGKNPVSNTINVVGNISGSNIQINQTVVPKGR